MNSWQQVAAKQKRRARSAKGRPASATRRPASATRRPASATRRPRSSRSKSQRPPETPEAKRNRRLKKFISRSLIIVGTVMLLMGALITLLGHREDANFESGKTSGPVVMVIGAVAIAGGAAVTIYFNMKKRFVNRSERYKADDGAEMDLPDTAGTPDTRWELFTVNNPAFQHDELNQTKDSLNIPGANSFSQPRY